MLQSETFTKDVVSLKSDTQLIFKASPTMQNSHNEVHIHYWNPYIVKPRREGKGAKGKRNKEEVGEKKNSEQKGWLNLGAHSFYS